MMVDPLAYIFQAGPAAVICAIFIWYLVRRDKEQTAREKMTQTFFIQMHQRDTDAMTKLTGAITSLVVVINTLSSDVANHDTWAHDTADRIERTLAPSEKPVNTRPARKPKPTGGEA